MDKQQQQPDLERYDCKQLLELLSKYEGELQARDALIEIIQHEPHQQSTSSQLSHSFATILPARNANDSVVFDSLFRDSLLIDGEHASRCASCGNKLLHTAKMLQIQRDCDRKLFKALNLMSKRHARVSQELDIKEKRLQAISEEDKKYARTLEAERDQLLEQLKKRQSECAELEEQKSSLQDRLCEQTEREKHIVLFLIEERKNILAQMQEVNKHLQDASSSITASASSVSTTAIHLDESHPQIRALHEENKRIHHQLISVQAEKTSLQKRLDYLLKDLQQSAFHQQFQFLQPKYSNEKEMIVIGNGLIPSHSMEPFIGSPNRIRNSSSFPQSFEPSSTGHKQTQYEFTRGRMPEQFPVARFEQRQTSQQNNIGGTGNTASVIPLNATNSTSIMRKPPPFPKTLTKNPPSQQQFRRQSIEQQHPNPNTTGTTTIVSLGMPQTSITRRSTSLPRRIVSSAVSPSSSKSQQQYHRKDPSAEHFYYNQRLPPQGPPIDENHQPNNKVVNNFI